MKELTDLELVVGKKPRWWWRKAFKSHVRDVTYYYTIPFEELFLDFMFEVRIIRGQLKGEINLNECQWVATEHGPMMINLKRYRRKQR